MCVQYLLSQTTSLFPEWTDRFFKDADVLDDDPLIDLLLFLEVICFIEVGRIAVGQLRGNLVLGVVLHMIRMTCILLVLPDGLAGKMGGQLFLSMLVLYSWSLECCRYPMYILPGTSAKARNIRLIMPIFTFPVGAAAEAIGAYRILTELLKGDLNDDEEDDGSRFVYWIKIGSLGMVVLINSVLGPTMAYPALLKRGLPVLTGKAERKKES